ncbi:hypothetical protein U370_02705 [Anaplasma marginale str. Dawn]|uniref:hypothetical protein n=1 Tax=Anaplasma marginale TaxID=770 RepID=UPI0003C2ABA7|nr:hypothetical protein [Anaplasma marginale]AGZ78906.1 hypothetical protein U128_02760 [Anaplasma marginale str. Gypsy Plains]AGZ79736.1 hypothetical protein U370_02705 [Anaplasma marginale str. Dawn]
MQQPLEYITELTMQIVFVIEREMECLRLRDKQKFKELQDIEGELLQLLEKTRSKVVGNTEILHGSSPAVLEKLNLVFSKFDKCLAGKHALLAQMS